MGNLNGDIIGHLTEKASDTPEYPTAREQQDAIEASPVLQGWLGFGTQAYNLTDIPSDSQEYIDAVSAVSVDLVEELGRDHTLLEVYAALPPRVRSVDRPNENDVDLLQSDLQGFAWRYIDREYGHGVEAMS